MRVFPPRKRLPALRRSGGWLLAAGLLCLTAAHGRLWLKDRQRLSQLDPPPDREWDPVRSPRVSFLVPAWDESENIRTCIESILCLSYPNKEVVVCAGGSDGTLEITREYAGEGVVVLEQHPGEGKQGALRRSFERSSGEIIFLTDADCRLDDGCLKGTLGPLLFEGEEAATGSWKPLESQLRRPFVQYQWSHHLYREGALPAYAPTLDGRNAAIQRTALEQVSAFQTPAPVGTDYVLSKQLTTDGFRIRFVPGSRVSTQYPETFSDYARQISRWFRNPLVMGRRWGERELRRAHLRAGLGAWLMLGLPVAAGLFGRNFWYPWGVLSGHLLLCQLRYTYFARRRCGTGFDRLSYFVSLPVYMVAGWSALARSLLDTFNPLRQKQW